MSPVVPQMPFLAFVFFFIKIQLSFVHQNIHFFFFFKDVKTNATLAIP